jgi:hypothetical protein
LITDEGMSPQACTALAGRSVEVIRAGKPDASLSGSILAANKN